MPRAPSPVREPGLTRGNRDYDAGTGTTSHSIRSRSRTGTTTPRAPSGNRDYDAGTGTTTEEHLKATGHHAKRHHSRVLSPVSRAPSPVLEPGLTRGNRDFFAGTGTTSPRAGTGTIPPRAPSGNRDYDAGTGTTSHSIRSRSRTGTTKPRSRTGTTSEEHLKATGHHAKRHHSRAPSPVLEPGLTRGNRDYDAGTGTTTPRAETGTTSQTKSLKTPAGTEFIAHFGSFNGQREQQRWETLVEAIGWARAQEIASWAERKEIHMINRGGLMDSLETAAKKWQERKPGGKATAEERQMRNMENIRKGLEMAEVADGKF